MLRWISSLCLGTVCFVLPQQTDAADWPMWRADAQRSAATTEQLPPDLKPQWTRSFSPRKQAWDDPLNLDLMTYDRVFEPIVLDGRLIVGFNDRDKVAAFDTRTGEKLWEVFTDGPVRMPPAGANGKVYFASDDGCLYCVDVESGNLHWKFRGAPSAQQAIGNLRLTSAWPARGGPVIRDGSVYFAASIWPMMGTFIYALDADTGDVLWVNDGTGAQYIKQPHSAPSFAGVAPQGALVATQDQLVVPGGRSVPAVFDRHTGELQYFEINAGGKGTGGAFIAANESHFFVHTRLKGTRSFDLKKGVKTAFMPNEPVLNDGMVYSAESKDDKHFVRAYGDDEKLRWEIAADGSGDLILAGDKLYAAGTDAITIIQLSQGDQPASIVATIPVTGQVERLLAADGQLFAVTLEGSISAFGTTGSETVEPLVETIQPLKPADDASQTIAQLLAQTDAEGFAFWFGLSEESPLDALAAKSPFMQLAIVDEDQSRIDPLRQKLDAAEVYGAVTAHCFAPSEFRAPKYVANVIFVGSELTASNDTGLLRQLYESVRPYGGVMHLLAEDNRKQLAEKVQALDLEQAEVTISDHSVVVRRVGKLPGSADWTHQYGNVANTIKSDDKRVKLPLGVLWFGGSSNMDVLPRHGHGPPEQVVGGRLIIEGMNSLSARDVYTGRVLWKREFENLGTYDVYYDVTYDNTPLNPKYNQVHIPGANGRGTNYIVTEDRVYLAEGNRCHVLDPQTGKTLQEIVLPADASGEQREWGYIAVYEDILLGGRGFAMYQDRNKLSFVGDKILSKNRAGFGTKSLDRAASLGLVAFDRHTGEELWKIDAKHSFWHNGIVAGGGKIYCLDRVPEKIEAAMKRRGVTQPDSYRIAAFDAKSGELVWETAENIFGSWLGYSAQHDLLLQAGAAASDRLSSEIGRGMSVHNASDGSIKWQNETLKYSGPCILHNEWIYTNANSYSESAGAFHLLDGHQKLVPNPLTGELQPWKLTRAYGCNSIIASENLLTFRSGAAGFYDLLGESGAGNFGGFKSGCTSNLVVANGVLNAPDYTRTCSCSYQNQTSLALVHMPDLEFWTINLDAAIHSTKGELTQAGINFGAPGDRRQGDVLWLEYPAVGGPSPPLSIELNEAATFFRHHSSAIDAEGQSWILASGVEHVRKISIDLNLAKKTDLEAGIPVNHPDDDAEEQEDGDVSLTSSDLELVKDGGVQIIGVRFNNLNLLPGAKIRSAYLQLTCDETSDEPTTLLIAAEDSGNARRFSSDKHDVSSRPKTTREIGWTPGPWKRFGDAGDAQRSPDLAPLIQAVVNRDDWKPGNSLALIISGTGKRVAVASRSKADGAARLIIDADKVNSETTNDDPAETYRLRLFFAAPQRPGESLRKFDVALQGRTVLEDVTIDPRGESGERFAVHTLDNVQIVGKLELELIPKVGEPVLSGLEIVRTDQ